MCVNPYIATKKTSGEKVAVPCGKCLECRKQYQSEWSFRLSQEMKRTPYPAFVTLTYNDDYLPTIIDPADGVEKSVVIKSELQRFFKRLRKNGGDYMKECRYFAVGEYGRKSARAHYHIVIIAPHIPNIAYLRDLVNRCWFDPVDGVQMGFTSTKFCTQKQVRYVTKYMNKLDQRAHVAKPFRLYSRSIGLNFLTDAIVRYYLTSFDRTCINGHARIGLPRYYKRKLDELSDAFEYADVNWMMAKCGAKYSDLLEDVRVVEGTHWYYFKEFTTNYPKYYALACYEIVERSRVYGFQTFEPTTQEVFAMYTRANKVLMDLIRHSDRVLNDISIRNGIDKLNPIYIGNEDFNEHVI